MSRDGNWRFGHVTRHSIILVAAGLTFIAQGFSILEYVPGGPRWKSLVLARDIVSLDTWGILWMLVGVAVVVLAHWPNVARLWGYAFLTGWSAGWSMFYTIGSPMAERPLVAGLSNGAFWLLQSFIWWSISGLPDVAASRKVKMPLWIGSRKSD